MRLNEMTDKELNLYSKLITLRNLLKEVQQLSWDITQLDKKFPIQRAEEIRAYESLILVYLGFSDRIDSIASDFREVVYDDDVQEIKMRNNKKNENKNIPNEVL